MKFTRKLIAVEVTLLKSEFGPGKNAKTFDGFACDVEIEKAGFPSRNICRIRISGLSTRDMGKLTLVKPFHNEVGHNLVKVYAWAEDAVRALVFSGEIYLAYGIYERPDIEFYMESQTGIYASLVAKPPTEGEGSYNAIALFRTFAEEAEFAFTSRVKKTYFVRDPRYSGDPITKMRALARDMGLQILLDDNELIVMEEKVPRNDQVIDVNAQTGMIGYPRLQPTGIMVWHEYRPYFLQGGAINVRSIAPAANGKYKLTRLNHHLQSFGAGDSWDTQMEGILIG
jgi:hypothetical protein